jgi:hypothetical protein
MRDPRDVLKGRVEGRINDKVFGAQAKVDAAGQGLLNRATKAVDGAMDKAEGAGGKKKKKKKARMSWWPFGGGDEDESVPACPQCGQEVDPSWQACPYCGFGMSAAPAPLPNQGGPGGPVPNLPQMTGNRTQAIDIEQLKKPSRRLVGWIVIMNGPQQYTDYKIYEGSNSIGAAADNDIVVTDDYLSSKHAAIRFEDNEYFFIDNDSTNGSYVNEKKVSKEELIDNDTIRLGRTEFRFKALY